MEMEVTRLCLTKPKLDLLHQDCSIKDPDRTVLMVSDWSCHRTKVSDHITAAQSMSCPSADERAVECNNKIIKLSKKGII